MPNEVGKLKDQDYVPAGLQYILKILHCQKSRRGPRDDFEGLGEAVHRRGQVVEDRQQDSGYSVGVS